MSEFHVDNSDEGEHASEGYDWDYELADLDSDDEDEYDDDFDNYIQAQKRLRKSREQRHRQLNKERLAYQVGKYIITANKNGKTLYLQDPCISNHGYWTQFQANARVFNTKPEADKVNNCFKLGNPQVILVTGKEG